MSCAPGDWRPGTIVHENEDGTFTFEPDVKDMSFMPKWYDVPREELDDENGDAAKREARELSPYVRLYWNQTRMAGRDPADVARPVTLNDALGALGLVDARVESGEWTIVVPRMLREIFARHGALDAIAGCHPNSPEPIASEEWQLEKVDGVEGSLAVTFMNPHQGDHAWAAVFDEGDDDARIYLHAPGRPWALVARSAAFFFWDLAQTGIGWFNENEYEGGKPTRRTDIGVVLE